MAPAPSISTKLDTINPLKQPDLSSPELIIDKLLPYVFTFAGIILFAMLIMGGFEMLTAASDSKKADAGKARITSALIGFIIIFVSYWIMQLLEVVFGITLLGTK